MPLPLGSPDGRTMTAHPRAAVVASRARCASEIRAQWVFYGGPKSRPRTSWAASRNVGNSVAIDLDRLLKLDLAGWWNTKKQLGDSGARTLRRGFPRTHHFAQARSVFAVAAHRCAEVFEPPGCVTLWRLPDSTEEEFDAQWEHWLDSANDWSPFFQKLETLQGTDLVSDLRGFELIGERAVEAYGKLRFPACRSEGSAQ